MKTEKSILEPTLAFLQICVRDLNIFCHRQKFCLLIYLEALIRLQIIIRKPLLSVQDPKDKDAFFFFFFKRFIIQAHPDSVIKEYSCLISTLGLMINAVVGYYCYSSAQNPRECTDGRGLHYVNEPSCATSVVCLMKRLVQTVNETSTIPIPTSFWPRDS